MLWPLLYPALFSFFYRARGGFINLGHTQVARVLFWVLPVTIWAFTVASPWVAPLCGIMAFAGLMIPHEPFQWDNSLSSTLGMGAVGVARLTLITTPLLIGHPAALLLAPVGALSGVGYWAGYKYSDVFAPTSSFANCPTAWGEAFTGAAFGLAFMVISLARL